MLSRRVIAYYGLMRASESLPAAYGFAAGAAAPKENGLRWESRGSPIYSAGPVLACCLPYPGDPKRWINVSSALDPWGQTEFQVSLKLGLTPRLRQVPHRSG